MQINFSTEYGTQECDYLKASSQWLAMAAETLPLDLSRRCTLDIVFSPEIIPASICTGELAVFPYSNRSTAADAVASNKFNACGVRIMQLAFSDAEAKPPCIGFKLDTGRTGVRVPGREQVVGVLSNIRRVSGTHQLLSALRLRTQMQALAARCIRLAGMTGASGLRGRLPACFSLCHRKAVAQARAEAQAH